MAKLNDKIDNPFKYLRKDHKTISDLFKKIQKTSDYKKKSQLFNELDQELSLHAELEENTLYPVLENLKETTDIAAEALEEHHVVKQLLDEMRSLTPDKEEWQAKAKVLEENVNHHVEEEEGDGGMLKTADSMLDKNLTEELRIRMEYYLQTDKV